MCKVRMPRRFVNQRLTAAVEEIFVVLERTIAEYEEELCRTKEENERQRQLGSIKLCYTEHTPHMDNVLLCAKKTSGKKIFLLSSWSGAPGWSRRNHCPPTLKRKRRNHSPSMLKRKRRNTASVKRESTLKDWRSSQ
ncbi:uncharacterized protein LOC129178262 isoform X3 [Dunckerocampus dactyliophorus]|uniref:uncharacterized protein LOC129178262 isoform X3 n=1 Tax=Dunckerocampus dactyliophorus TaxID=161453 RepID=UPI002405954A|nr:uncharacterized protein LOC129178262 isoform X3 [Dunckerocampus dactyliophorus]